MTASVAKSAASEIVVWVVMSNDYPHCVFLNEANADKFVKEQNEKDKAQHPNRLIFWRSYGFGVRP